MLTIPNPGQTPKPLDRDRIHADLFQLDTARDHVRAALRALFDLDNVSKASPVLLKTAHTIGDETRNQLVKLDAILSNEMRRQEGALQATKLDALLDAYAEAHYRDAVASGRWAGGEG